MFIFELGEIHPECGTHYEMWKEQGIFFVYCPTCDKSWEPCESAMRQYRQWCEEPLTEVLTSLRKKQKRILEGGTMEDQSEQQAENNYRAAQKAAVEAYEAARKRDSEAYNAIAVPAGNAYERATAGAQKVFDEAIEPAKEAYLAAVKPAERDNDVAMLQAEGVYHAAMVEAIAAYVVVLQAPRERRRK